MKRPIRLSKPENLPVPHLRFSVMRSLHWMVAQGMKQAGYTWEARRSGDFKLGLWRKRWRSGVNAPRRLVLIPGFGDSPLSWAMVLSLMAPVVRRSFDEIVMVDFPGYGGFLCRERACHSFSLLKDAVFDVFDSLRPHTLLGHSLGGALSGLYAAECGGSIRPKGKQSGLYENYSGPERVILVDPSGVFPTAAERKELEAKFQEAVRHKVKGLDVLRPHIFAKEPFWFQFFAKEFSSFFASPEIEQFVHSFDQPELLETIAHQIRSQVWLIWGEKDSMIPVSCLSAWLEKVPGSKGIVLKGCGHSPQLEVPARVAAALASIFVSEGQRVPKGLTLPMTERWWRIETVST